MGNPGLRSTTPFGVDTQHSALSTYQAQISKLVRQVIVPLDKSADPRKRRVGHECPKQLIVTLRDLVRAGDQAIYLLQSIARPDFQFGETNQLIAVALQCAHYRSSYRDHAPASRSSLLDRLHCRCGYLEPLSHRQIAIDFRIAGR